ncbi:MAG: ASKHA domain-containing protein [Acidobacteria bacterium]|nr:ASKHA domain-containing protein [Acidobacteriota bacterium]
MTEKRNHRIVVRPTHVELTAPDGTSLRDLLFEQGVEFPCGGQGRCRGCRVHVLEGKTEINEAQRERLSAQELADGWRLACQCSLVDNLVIELRQWDAAILADDTPFSFVPRAGLGVAVDLGTTTLVAQLVNLATGKVLAVRTALNAQARYGADIMSRLQFGVSDVGQSTLKNLIRQQIAGLIHQLVLFAKVPNSEICDVVLVGNTVMHHLFCGIDVEPLSHYPFESKQIGLQTFRARDLEWDLSDRAVVRFLPCLGGFVGSDILAGVLATKLGESQEFVGLMDLGTNGEIVVGNREKLFCASTAAGPAFEGAKISMGMRAATGAISQVEVENKGLVCHVLGNVAPQGLCGSGLVDAVAAGLDVEVIQASGRLANGAKELTLMPPVMLTQNDIRELQLAKAAIAAGARILLERSGTSVTDLKKLYLAGAFGNYIRHSSAQRIGLINVPSDRIAPARGTNLLGAKLALFSLDGEDGSYTQLRGRIEHVPLKADANFQDIFVEELAFPSSNHVHS